MKYTIHVKKQSKKGFVWEPQINISDNDDLFQKMLDYVKRDFTKRRILPVGHRVI